VKTVHIKDVTPYLVHPGTGKNWLFVKVETDAGHHGWGECYTQTDRDRAIEAMINSMRRYLVGRDATAIKHLTHALYHDFLHKRGSMEFFSALSGIEQALWDAHGKALGVPVHRLLGGPCRERIRVYANGWAGGDKDPREVARRAKDLVARGFSALKWDPFPGPWREWISADDERAAVESVRVVRDTVGPDVDLLVECHRRLAPMHAVRVGRAMAAWKPFWFEEPVSSRHLAELAEVRAQVGLPVVTGEELYGKTEFREVFERRAADIINPDVCNTGGILELKEIAAMAEPYLVVVSPHNYNSTTVGLAATVHVSAAIPNFLITEYFVNFEAVGREIARSPLTPRDGYIDTPETPGLGIDLDEAALRARAYQDFPLHPMRTPREEA
jgi:galactonate dehydratase